MRHNSCPALTVCVLCVTNSVLSHNDWLSVSVSVCACSFLVRSQNCVCLAFVFVNFSVDWLQSMAPEPDPTSTAVRLNHLLWPRGYLLSIMQDHRYGLVLLSESASTPQVPAAIPEGVSDEGRRHCSSAWRGLMYLCFIFLIIPISGERYPDRVRDYLPFQSANLLKMLSGCRSCHFRGISLSARIS